VATPEEVIAWALEHEAEYEPGAEHQYSNTNYFVLGLIIEAVDGRPLRESMRARLFEPLGLSETFMESHEPEGAEHVAGHLGGILWTEPFSTTWAWASGGLVSTGRDLCVWMNGLVLEDVVPAEHRAPMLTPTVVDGQAQEYGLGVRFAERGGRPVVGHTGSTVGFDGEVFLHVESGMCMAVLTNDFFGAHRDVADPAWELLVSDEAPPQADEAEGP